MPRKTDFVAEMMDCRNLASMRPRPDAAENDLPLRARHPALDASMRPRPDAAENLFGAMATATGVTGLQ